mgnify:CR=1 FL=1
MQILRNVGEVLHTLAAYLFHRLASPWVRKSVEEQILRSGVPISSERKPRYVAIPPVAWAHFNLGKCEAEVIGRALLELSRDDVNSEWRAVPWPKLVGYYTGPADNVVQSFCWDVSLSKLIRYLAMLPRVPTTNVDDGGTFVGYLGGPMFEVSRTNGIPNFLVIGIRRLVDEGFVEILKGTGQEPDYLVPTQRLVDQIREKISRAA